MEYEQEKTIKELLKENGILIIQDNQVLSLKPPLTGYGKLTISFADGKPTNIETKETTKIKYK
ncbi:hypothetical protein [Listeria monocytogenes]|uniref:hypothetical protein n=1 Tax=Listeria monocytogenes TaxID=1639 RepID=UPI003F9518B5